MTDQFDRAHDLELAEWELRQKAAIKPHAKEESALGCRNCGDPIPEARRKAVPGCQLCIACQTYFETL